jgi:predicted  nucleic acid-binding Zn-ribbon protein
MKQTMEEDLKAILEIQFELMFSISSQISSLQKEIYDARLEMREIRKAQKSLHFDLRKADNLETEYGSLNSN